MDQRDLKALLEYSRQKTLELLGAIRSAKDAIRILAWRPEPKRAHLAWQLMHIAATDDRHLYVRMRGGQPCQPEFVRRFAVGSVPDDDVPSIDVIDQYLSERRREMIEHLKGLDPAQLSQKPRPDAPWVYEEWFKVLAWHEAHHHGQAHLTLNLYRATQDGSFPKTGH